MGDLGESFRAIREHNREQAAKRRDKNIKYIEQVAGFERKEMTPYQHRFYHDSVGAFIDLYPTNSRYHNLVTGERGRYKTAQRFLELQLDRTIQFKQKSAKGASNESRGEETE